MASPKIIQGNPDEISIVKAALQYEVFLEKFLRPNKPCLISPDLTEFWPAMKLWRSKFPSDDSSTESTNNPDWNYIQKHFGAEKVTVAKCGTRSFSDQERVELPLHEVIDLWRSGKGEGLYVKDWHLARSVKERGMDPFYETPDVFLDDWMNSFWENELKEDDFRFVVRDSSSIQLSILNLKTFGSIWVWLEHSHPCIVMYVGLDFAPVFPCC